MGKKSGGRVRVKQIGPKLPTNPLADLAVPPEEEIIQLPTKPDSNSGFLIWPMGETFTMSYKSFRAIYPNCIDSNKSIKLGRLIAAKDAVPEPTMQDIHEALVTLNIRHVIQPHKGYSRDAFSRWYNPGRVLVDLEGAAENGILDRALGTSLDGSVDLDAIPELKGGEENQQNKENTGGNRGAKKQLLRQLAGIIRGLPNREKRLVEMNNILQEEKIKMAEAEKVAVTSGGSSGGVGNRKKKGKKKK